MAKRNKTKKLFKSNLKLEALEQRQLLAGVVGSGTELTTHLTGADNKGADNYIVASNGNHYDQVLLTGTSVSVTNDVGNITRVSFLDLQGDIVQAEFGGAGTLTISLDAATAVAGVQPTKYNQTLAGGYEQGLASFSIQGSDSTTNFTVFSVGSSTAFPGNTLFDTDHTGGNNTADVQRITVVANPSNPNGSTFGGIRAGNAIFGADSGVVGIAAANVQVQDVVTVGDIKASGTATPTLVFGGQSQFGAVTVAGGGLVEANGASINNTGSYKFGLTFAAGTTSAGTAIAVQTAPVGLSFSDNNPITAATKTFTLTTGVDTIVGTSGNDAVNTQIGASDTLTALDSIDGGSGTDSLTINDVVGGTALPGGITLKAVEVINLASAGVANIDTSGSGITGLTTLNVTTSTGADTITAGAGHAVTVYDSAGLVTVDGGSSVNITTAGGVTVGATTAPAGAITVTDTKQANVVSAIDGGTSVTLTTSADATGAATGAINIGAVTAPTGAIVVTNNQAGDQGANRTAGAVGVKGGTTVSVTTAPTQKAGAAGAAGSTTTSYTLTEPAVTVTGTKTTTAVTVNQAATVAKKDTIVALAGITESDSVVFGAATAGQTVILAGLTYTAPAGGATAKQVAAAFASLGSTTGITGWTTGAVSGAGSDTVTFTSSTSDSDVGDLADTGTGITVITKTDGAAKVSAQGGVGGITQGAVTINDANLGTASATISSATLSNYAASTIASGALTTLSLTSGGTLGITNDSKTTLDLTTSGTLGAITTTNTAATSGVYTTLNVHASGDTTLANFTDAQATALTVDGAKTLTLTTAAGLSGIKTVTVSGSAGLKAGTTLASSFNAATVTDVNASATSGAVTVSIDPTATTYEGGSGVDSVTIGAAPTKAISGGAGTADVLTLNVIAATFSNPSTNTNISGFETLGLGALANGAYDATGFTALTNGAVAAAVNYTNVAAGTGLTISAAPTAGVTYTLKTDTAADALTVSVKGAAALTATGIESVTVNTTDDTAALTLTDTAVTTLTLTGAKNLAVINAAGNTALVTVNGAALTGKLTYTTEGSVAETVTGGSKDDTLTAKAGTQADTLIGGAGKDTLTANAGLDTLTGGADNDIFVMGTRTANLNTYSVITDASAGDVIKLINVGAETFNATKVTLQPTAGFQDYANAVVNAGGAAGAQGYIGWFQYSDGNTYIVESMHDATVTPGYVENATTGDLVVKLTGLVDLSGAAMVQAGTTPEIVIR